MENSEKKKDIITFIRTYISLQSMKKDIIPAHAIGVLAQYGKEGELASVSERVWEKMASDSFIEELVPAFDAYYTHDEIKMLLTFYQSDLMKRTTSENDPTKAIFASIADIAKEVIAP